MSAFIDLEQDLGQDLGQNVDPDVDPDALVELFEQRGWGDGLPLVAPTEARVEAMLAAGAPGCDPDEVVAVLEPRRGVATRRLIAVNAVLAGCRPAQLPVLVSAVRAIARPEVNLRGVTATTHPVAPLLIVHGDVVETAGYRYGTGAFGPGNRANATTGRALRLILVHIGGATVGDGDASTQGGPAKYGFCGAEHLAASPWGGLAASRGVTTPSAVTVHFGEGPHNVHDMETGEPDLLLDKLASAMTTLGQNNACISQGEYVAALCPEHAAVLAGGSPGHPERSRGDIATALWERARHPAWLLRRHFASVAWADWMVAADDAELLPMTESPDNIHLVVIGGAGKHSSIVPSWGMTRSVTVAVRP